MKGVEVVNVEFEKRRLDIAFDDKVVTERQIVEAAKGIGFTLVESSSAEDAPLEAAAK